MVFCIRSSLCCRPIEWPFFCRKTDRFDEKLGIMWRETRKKHRAECTNEIGYGLIVLVIITIIIIIRIIIIISTKTNKLDNRYNWFSCPQIRRAIDLVHFVIKDGVLPEVSAARRSGSARSRTRKSSNSATNWRMEEFDKCLTTHNALNKFHVSFRIQLKVLSSRWNGNVWNEVSLAAKFSMAEDITNRKAYFWNGDRVKIKSLSFRLGSKWNARSLLRGKGVGEK